MLMLSRLKIEIEDSDLDKIKNVKVYNIKRNEDKLYLDISKKDLSKLDIEHKIIENKTIGYLIKSNIIFLIGMILIFVITVTLEFTITSIEFSSDYYKEEIEAELEKYIDERFNVRYFNIPLYELNKKIKTQFIDLIWINVSKTGSKVYVDNKYEEYLQLDNTKKECDIISNHHGYITNIICDGGEVIVEVGQTIEKGDTLVSSLVNSKPTETSAIVVCRYNDYLDIEVKKNDYKIIRSGKIKKQLIYSFFNIPISKTINHYQNYDVEYINLINLGNIMTLNMMVEYENIELNSCVSPFDSLEISKKMIYESFEVTSIYDKILSYQLIDSNETVNSYKYRYLVSYQKNVAIYKK